MSTHSQPAQISMTYEPQDICAKRHRGSQNSVAANPDSVSKARMRMKILTILAIGKAMCIHDLESALQLSANHFSGRLTALKADALVTKSGTCEHGHGGMYWITEAGRAVVIG